MAIRRVCRRWMGVLRSPSGNADHGGALPGMDELKEMLSQIRAPTPRDRPERDAPPNVDEFKKMISELDKATTADAEAHKQAVQDGERVTRCERRRFDRLFDDDERDQGLRQRARYQNKTHRYMERNAVQMPDGRVIVPRDKLGASSHSSSSLFEKTPQSQRRLCRVSQAIMNTLDEVVVDDAVLGEHLDVIGVSMTNDLRIAHVYWTADDRDRGRVQHRLDRIQGALRHAVARGCPLKFVPSLEFKFETGWRASALRDQYDR
ncbi:Ribosome-binding factor A [Plasmodiophora brassicae]|uniref:Ribosome-binding factor A n=1 Tax=Plasmodiophora brassicae TaxID=37360 RepID=A0A0G4J2F6_PLABS|nr:hypothetical protein PBRA_008667 [Plasmodiophora brassicae]